MKSNSIDIVENNNIESNAHNINIAAISFVLSVMVMFIHNSTLSYYNYSNNSYIVTNLFSYIIPRVAVPLFFIMSGFLFYRNFTYSIILKKYKSRFKSLFIPYLFWNIFSLVFAALVTYLPFVRSMLSGRKLFEPSVINILSGIFLHKYYSPFWFIEGLIIFILFCPIIYLFLRQRYLGAIAFIFVCVLYGFGIDLPQSIFANGDVLIYYLFGSYLGIHHSSILNLKFGYKGHILGTVGSVLSIILLYQYPYLTQEYSLNGIIRVVILLMYCISFWLMFDFFAKYIKNYWWFSISFIVFATHLYIQPIIAKMIYIVMPKNITFAIINYFISGIVACFVMIITSQFLKKYLPKMWKIASGNR